MIHAVISWLFLSAADTVLVSCAEETGPFGCCINDDDDDDEFCLQASAARSCQTWRE